jgi:4-aminobutyrate aminotransferase-like enzyme
MSKSYMNVAAMALVVAAVSVQAQTAAPGEQRIEIRGNPTALAAAKVVMEKRNVDAVFQMSSGRSMEVLSDGDALSVRYGRIYASTLRHDGQGNFVSQDRKMSMQFRLDGSGDVQTASLNVPASWR